MSIADQIIDRQGSSPSSLSSVPDGYYLDDLGYYVEKNLHESKERMAEYALFRILKKHKNIYNRNGMLFCGHTVLTGDSRTLLQLIDSPNVSINQAQAAWIYNRIKEVAPEFSDRYIKVADGLVWDMEESELVNMDNIITVNSEE